MKRPRLPVLVAGALGVLLVLAVAVAFNSGFQTWAARRAIAKQPGLRLTFDSLSAGTSQVELKRVRYETSDFVLTLPLVELELPVMTAAWDQRMEVRRLVAKGWTLDLSPAKPAEAVSSARASSQDNLSGTKGGAESPPGRAAVPNDSSADATASHVFVGIFTQLRLPTDLSLDGVDLSGEVILPESRGRVKVVLTGGGLASGREGKFDVQADATLSDPQVKTIELRGGLAAGMDTPRTFTRFGAKLDAAATGTKFPRGVKLSADLSAARGGAGEAYRVGLVTEGRELIRIDGELPHTAPRLSGGWKVDFRDVDVAPFAFGKPLPTFAATGEGAFDGDARFEAVHVTGRLATTISGLQTIRPELAALGELKMMADFDLAEKGGTFAVQKLEAAINGAQPVATIRALQAFEFNPSTGALRTADLSHELVGLALHALPVAWVAPFLKDVQVAGGYLRGELSAAARNGGLRMRSTAPMLVDAVTVTAKEKTYVKGLDLSFSASTDYTSQGWQAEVSDLAVKAGNVGLLTLEAKAGQLAGKDQPLKATGKLNANLPAWLTQPLLAGSAVLTSGDVSGDFVVSLNTKTEIQTNLALKNLATGTDANLVKLPSITTQLRADLSPDGRIAFNAPLVLERADRKSDLTLIGTIGPEKEKLRAVEAEVSSTQLVVGDAQVLAAIVPDKTGKKDGGDPAAPTRDSAPPWAGLHGALTLSLKHVVYSDAVQMSNVTGRVRIDAGMLKLETLQAGLGETGRANLTGTLTFNSSAAQPYALAADVAVREFDPGPLLRAMTDNQAATVEGKFDVTSKLAGKASTLAEIASGAEGHFQVTSKGGVFRGLPVNVGNIVENTSKLAAWISSAAGSALNAVTGKKDYADVANKAEAVAEVTRGLNPIPYDQLSVVVSRDAAMNTIFRNFTLISPEVRLTGNGTALHRPGTCVLEDPLAMEFTLRARGRQGELLKYLGALEAQTDDLGYATCSVPMRVGGTLGKPDTSELNSKLTALAIEKSGFGDKAAEFLNKIRGVK